MYRPAIRPVSLSLLQRQPIRTYLYQRISQHLCSNEHHGLLIRSSRVPCLDPGGCLPGCGGSWLPSRRHFVTSRSNDQSTRTGSHKLPSGHNASYLSVPHHSGILPWCAPSTAAATATPFLQIASGSGLHVPLRQHVRHSSTEPTTVYESLLASQPVHFAESIFQYAHSLTGLPWWAAIMVTTFTLRLSLTLPLAVYSQNIRARVETLQPEVIALAKRAFVERFAPRAKNEKWSEKRAQRVFVGLVRRYSKELYVRDNCHPAKGSILFLVQLPTWIFLSLALRNMTGAFSERMYVDPSSVVPELATGGTLWFSSLAAPDPCLILPVMVGILNLANIEMHALHKGRVTRVQRYVNNTLRTVSVVMIPIAAYVPSAMALYWTVSALYGLGQNILLKLPSARRALGIRPSETDSSTPFQDMGEEFMERYIKRSKGTEPSDEVLEAVKDDGQDGRRKAGKKSQT